MLFVEAERLGPEELERVGEAIRERREALRSIVQRSVRRLRQLGRKTA